jgi:hypothetical protein
MQQFCAVDDSGDVIIVISMNVQSLIAHDADLSMDRVVTNSH